MSKKAKTDDTTVVLEPETNGAEIPEAKPDKFGAMVLKESSQGHALSVAFAQDVPRQLNKLLGKKFHVTATGLSVVDGSKITEADAARAIATLAETSERASTVGTTTMLALGDLVLAIRTSLGDELADNLIQQTVSITGKSKHTIQDAERTAQWANEVFKDQPRPENLTPTHWQEFKNYSRDRDGKVTIPAGKVRSIMAKVAEGKVVGKGIEDGKEVEQRKPLSCAETRELLKEARGDDKNPKPSPKKKTEATQAPAASGYSKDEYVAPDGFLYVQDTENVYWSEELEDDALKLTDADGEPVYGIVIDIANRTLIKPGSKGKKLADIADLPAPEAEASEELPG